MLADWGSNMIDRNQARRQILAAAREMAAQHPTCSYETARDAFGMLGRIKELTNHIMPTAKHCLAFVGLDRSAVVDEFEFALADIARTAAEDAA